MKKKNDLFTIICALVLVGAFIVCMGISLFSEFGAHPDEYDVRACMDWAMSHWIWPDMRLQGTGLGDTYSLYGYTKMSNYTIYFLLMSKIAFFFKLFMGAWPYYRVPNLLLALFMLVILLKNINKKNYLMLAFGVCVQAWYIFAYVTADALDFVWAFLAIYLLADENSLLWKAINEVGTIKRSIFLGLLYGMILLGKPYYYAILVLTFVVLLLNLIDASKESRKNLWKNYIIILLICASIFAARAGLDFYYYGSNKAEIKAQMMELHANDDKKPSTPIEEQLQSYHAHEKGYPVSFIFENDPQWFVKSYRSYVSARITVSGDDWYYILIAGLYLSIYVWIGMELCGKKNRKKNNVILFCTVTCLMAGAVIASIANSYLIDSQPQGRYLLPITLELSYIASKAKRLWNNKIFKGLVIATGCLAVIYFGLFDSRKLIDLAYVKSLIG